jgi:hypothetical protein
MYGTARIAGGPLGRLVTVRIRSFARSEHAAERHYGEVVKDSDLSAVRNAAAEWRTAADALTQYLAKHPYRRKRM